MVWEKTLRGIVLTGIFILPFIVLIVAQSMFFPFITGKNFIFRIITEIIACSWLALALMYDKYRPRRSWVLAAFSLFVLIMAIADAQGAYPFKSFWSNYERMDGWVTIIHVLAYLFVAACVVNSERVWRLLFQTSLGVSVFVGVYGFLQLGGYTALGGGVQTASLSSRIDATFGNPIYLAVYMLFNIFIAALLWYQMWQVRPAGRRLAPSLAYGAIIALDTLVLFFTGTRGTMLGLFGGTVVTLLLLAFIQGTRRLRTIAISVLIGLVVLGGVLKLAKDTPIVQKIGFLQRLATITLSEGTTQSRLLNMGIAWQGVKERPILGWGQENYAIVFDKYYDPRMYGNEPWFDRVHDVIFDWWVTGGTLGLLAYLSIFAALFWVLWKREGLSTAERAIFTGLIVGYFFHNLFVFDNVTSWISFATVVAYIVWRTSVDKHERVLWSGQTLPKNAVPAVAGGALLLAIGVVWFTNAAAYEANLVLLQAVAPQQGGVEKNLEYFKQAIAYGAFGTQEAREQLSQVSASIRGAQNISDDTKKAFLTTAISEMQLQEKASPLDARFPLFMGVLLDVYGDYKDANDSLQNAHELSPRKQSILNEMAQNAAARGDNAEMLKYLKESFELLETNNAARLVYAAALIRSGNDAEADKVLAPSIENGQAADPQIASAYLSRGRYDKIIAIWEAYVAVNPSNTQGYFTLAAAYYSMGNKEKAIQSLQSAEKADPSITQEAEALIQQVRTGTAKVQ